MIKVTILHKRDNYWQMFANFAAEKTAGDAINPNAVKNARDYLEIMEKEGAFSQFLWDFVDGRPIQNNWQSIEEVPTETAVSRKISKALKQYGFSFVGPTIIYAYMQAVGLCNDHVVDCFRHKECKALASR